MRKLLIILCLTLTQVTLGQVTFVIDKLPEAHDFNESIFVSGDFEDWSGGQEKFKLKQTDKSYSITLPKEVCNLLFKFTLGSWSSVEVNVDGSALDNRSYNCSNQPETIHISIHSWATLHTSDLKKSTAQSNVQILSEEFKIPQLNRTRRIWVYTPPDYKNTTENYPVIYMHDGQNLFDETTSFAGEWNVDETLNRLYHDLGLKFIVVGIDNGGDKRINEYAPWDHSRFGKGEGELYADFVVSNLKPYIDSLFRTKKDAKNTVMIGSSMGGLITHYTVLKYPKIFGKAGIFSPSFWYSNKSYEYAENQSSKSDVKFFFLAGDQEGATMVPNVKKMIFNMMNSGLYFKNIENKIVPKGRHNEKLWREHFEDAILWLFDVKKPILGNSSRKLKNISIDKNNVKIEVNDGSYKIKYYTNEIVETTFIPIGQLIDKESHAVVLNPVDVKLKHASFKQVDSIFSPNGINVAVHHNPFQISYAFKGKTISSEKKGYHKTEEGEAIQLNVSLDEVLYGGGARALGMNRRGNRLQLYNKAHYGYEDHSPLMNYSMPIVISSKKYMIHFDNAPIGYLDLDSNANNTLTYETISGRKTYQVIVGESWQKLIDNYTDLTGKQPLPPRWAFGNFASRFGYHTQQEVESTISKYKEDKIPVDAVILDVFWFGKDIQGHMGNLEFLKDSFPEPKQMIKNLKKQGVKTTLITEPFVLSTSNRWNEVLKEDVLAKDKEGNPYRYDFYFGNTGLIDVYDEKAKNWFWNIYKELDDMGVDGVWGDLGEPEVHPSDLIHATGKADEVHNTYGHEWAKLVYEGYRKDIPNKRPFILMRAGYSGSQRYGLIPWSGDVNRTWGGFHPQVEIALQMGMQGLGYMHSDLGGFAGNNLDDELYVRWLQYGVFQPLFRPHAQEVVPSEPVYRSEKAKALAKKAIELRYQMLPYNYNLAYQNNQTGLPFIRPLFYEDDAEEVFTNSTTVLWGKDFLVTPIINPEVKEQEVYFPKGSNWVDFYSDQVYKGGQVLKIKTKEEYIPTYVRSGSFVLMTPLVQSTDDYTGNSFVLHYYFNPSQKDGVERKFYNDDGVTPKAKAKEKYEILAFEAEVKNGELEVSFEAELGKKWRVSAKQIELIVHNLDWNPKSVLVNGKKAEFSIEDNKLNLLLNWKTSKEFRIKIKR